MNNKCKVLLILIVTIGLLFTGYRYQFKSNEFEVVNLMKSEKELKDKVDDDKPKDETILYKKLLKGDFSVIEDAEAEEYMEYLYESYYIDNNWKYVIIDLNNDGIEDLYIQMSNEYDSALFTVDNGQVKYIYIDALEANCYKFPLRSGKFVEVYDYWIAPTTTVVELDEDFNWINTIQYIKSNNQEYIVSMNDKYQSNIDYSIKEDSQEYRYYYNSSDEKRVMNEEEWNQAQDDIRKNKIDLIDLDNI